MRSSYIYVFVAAADLQYVSLKLNILGLIYCLLFLCKFEFGDCAVKWSFFRVAHLRGNLVVFISESDKNNRKLYPHCARVLLSIIPLFSYRLLLPNRYISSTTRGRVPKYNIFTRLKLIIPCSACPLVSS